VFNLATPQIGPITTSHYAGDFISHCTAPNGALVGVGLGRAFPYWPFVATAATVSLIPWLRWRFSLRTLLIATTLVAVGLGLFFAASR
jgi:hypothetical protein